MGIQPADSAGWRLKECLGLHNKPKAEVHPGHKPTGPKKKKKKKKKKNWYPFIIIDLGPKKVEGIS
jgi:hypothetical protein